MSFADILKDFSLKSSFTRHQFATCAVWWAISLPRKFFLSKAWPQILESSNYMEALAETKGSLDLPVPSADCPKLTHPLPVQVWSGNLEVLLYQTWRRPKLYQDKFWYKIYLSWLKLDHLNHIPMIIFMKLETVFHQIRSDPIMIKVFHWDIDQVLFKHHRLFS